MTTKATEAGLRKWVAVMVALFTTMEDNTNVTVEVVQRKDPEYWMKFFKSCVDLQNQVVTFNTSEDDKFINRKDELNIIRNIKILLKGRAKFRDSSSSAKVVGIRLESDYGLKVYFDPPTHFITVSTSGELSVWSVPKECESLIDPFMSNVYKTLAEMDKPDQKEK